VKARKARWVLWLLIGGLAATIALWQWVHPPQLPALSVTGAMPQLSPPPALPVFQLPLLEYYGDIITHPVFIATRLPEPPPEDVPPVAPPPVGPEPVPVLLGIMIMPQATVALLRPEQPGAKTVRIRIGEMVGEWRLDAVFSNRVVLSKGAARLELVLVRPKPPAGSRPGKRIGAKPPPVATPPSVLPGAPPPNPL
jgi:hypothetical protein